MKIRCLECGKEFTAYNSLQRKYCSSHCYWESRKGSTHSWGDKISASLTGKPKTPEHSAKVAAALRIRKNKKCKVCNEEFYPQSAFQAYCSPKCWRSTRDGVKRGKCKVCGTAFEARYKKTYCSKVCYGKDLSEKRKGEKNPAYRNGFAMQGSRKYGGAHLRACAKYRKAFMEKRTYPICEICGVNQMGTLKFEVHHIYFASLYPRHPQLHNFLNLIHICIQCHNDLHAGKKSKEVFERLERQRGLKKLFGKV